MEADNEVTKTLQAIEGWEQAQVGYANKVELVKKLQKIWGWI